MSLPENNIASIEDLSNLIEALPDQQVKLLSDLVRRREMGMIEKKIDPLPDMAHNEFRIFDDTEKDKVTDKVLDIRRRRYLTFIYYYSNFDRTDDQMIDFIKLHSPELSNIQAARDLNKIKSILANMTKIRRELIRYQVIEMHKRAYQVADKNNDPAGMAAAANGITKAAQLDKDLLEIEWDKMIAPSFEPTDNLEALGEGFGKTVNLEAEIARMKKKYDDIEDAEVL